MHIKKVFWYEFRRKDSWMLLKAAFRALIHGKHTIWMGYEEAIRIVPPDIADKLSEAGWLRKAD